MKNNNNKTNKTYTVIFKPTIYNPYRSYPSNADRYINSKFCETLEEARAFAKTVNVKHIIDNTTGLIVTEY